MQQTQDKTREFMFQHTAARRRLVESDTITNVLIGFNTQPPEGGWRTYPPALPCRACFNTQPPEGGWRVSDDRNAFDWVSTHSRPKAAGAPCLCLRLSPIVSTHSRPKAAGVSKQSYVYGIFGFNTQPPEGGWIFVMHIQAILLLFQHTAARRRLGCRNHTGHRLHGFNTQPPEGGWLPTLKP